MRHAALIQKPIHGPTAMDALTVFRLATIEGAKALHIENQVGSIEVGKNADLVLLDLEKADQPLLLNDGNVYSSIVYSASKENVKVVMTDGNIIVNEGRSLIYDEKEIVETGKKELNRILKQIAN